MLDEAYSKKRKLDREKRAMDRPKEGTFSKQGSLHLGTDPRRLGKLQV